MNSIYRKGAYRCAPTDGGSNENLRKSYSYQYPTGKHESYHPRLSRADIARRTGLTRSTVTVITAELMATGLLREGRETASGSEGGASWCGVRTRSRGSLLYRGCDWS